MTSRFERAIAAIDAANADDPNTIEVRGEIRPKELAHAALATEWVRRLVADPSEPLLLAARAHHLRRWALPRSEYPAGRAGYLRWKAELQRRHATEVGELLRHVGYDEPSVERVQAIVRKRALGTDPEVQAFEDALCLVFVETQYRDLAARTEPATMRGVVAKTVAKMSPGAVELAVGLEPELARWLSDPDPGG